MHKNIKLIFTYNFLHWFIIFIPVAVPFFKSKGLNMEQVFQLQAFFAFVMILFEVPSGYISDMWGRVKTLYLSVFLEIVSGYFLFTAEDFVGLLLFEFFIGVALSLKSGTDISLLYDSLHAIEGKANKQTKIMAKLFTISNSAEALGSILAGILSFFSLELVVGAYLVKSFITVIPLLGLEEPPRDKMAKGQHLLNFKKILRFIRRGDELIFLIFINLVFYGLSTYIVIWAYQHMWQQLNIPIYYFGFLWAISNFSNAYIAKFVPTWEDKFGAKPLLISLGLLSVLGYLLFGFFHWSIWSLFIMPVFSIGRAITGVLMKDAFNFRLLSEFRATANSLHQFTFRLVFIFLGPLMGYLIDKQGTSAMMFTSAGIYTLVFIFLLLPLLAKIKKVHQP